jgi:hypothetical protein
MRSAITSFCLLVVVSRAQMFADEVQPEGEQAPVVGINERIVVGTPRPQPEFTAAEIALSEAMDSDASYTKKTGVFCPRDEAVAAWFHVLERRDLAKEQQIFAWWRIGSLYSYNFDVNRDEKSDDKKAALAMGKVRKLVPWLVAHETLNSATVYGTIAGSQAERVPRLADAFNWLMTRTEEDIDRSARQVNSNGGVLDQKFFPGRERTLDERKEPLRKQLAEYQKSITDRVTRELVYKTDPEAIENLLETIEKNADPKTMEKWRQLHRDKPKRITTMVN